MHAFSTLDAELRRARRSRAPPAVVMLDIDWFKQVNDAHGYLHGDRLLAAVGATLRKTLRTSDVKYRYGGDEFSAILPETRAVAAQHVAQHLRRALDGMNCPGCRGHVPCCVRVGVAAAAPGELDAFALVPRADEALYRDKVRNRDLRLIATGTD